MKRDTDISQEVALIWNTANDMYRKYWCRQISKKVETIHKKPLRFTMKNSMIKQKSSFD